MEEFREGSRNDPRIVQVMMMITKMMMRMMGANKNGKRFYYPLYPVLIKTKTNLSAISRKNHFCSHEIATY